MSNGWISLDEVARRRAISVEDARALAIRMRWPCVFKRDETLVLPSTSET
jgi:hypothetical protein